MGKKVKWGILSTAHINQKVIPAIKESERATLYAVASRNLEKAQAYAKEWEIPVAHGSYEALLADPDIDSIYLSLPNHLHTLWTVHSLRAGKHVLCEKPLCLTLDEHASIVQTVQETGKYAAEAFMYLHHPQMTVFKSIVDSGKYGKITALMSSFCFKFGRGDENYRMSESNGGGSLWDVGVYPISLFQYLVGATPLGVNGRKDMRGPVDINFWGILEYPGDITGQFISSFDTDFTTQTSIVMERGRLDISHPFISQESCIAEILTEGGVESLELPHASLYAGEVEDINDIVLNDASPYIPLNQSLRHLETVLALYESAEIEKPVVL